MALLLTLHLCSTTFLLEVTKAIDLLLQTGNFQEKVRISFLNLLFFYLDLVIFRIHTLERLKRIFLKGSFFVEDTFVFYKIITAPTFSFLLVRLKCPFLSHV